MKIKNNVKFILYILFLHLKLYIYIYIYIYIYNLYLFNIDSKCMCVSHSKKTFSIGENVPLKVREKKRSLKLRRCKKLTARYCGPFEALSSIVPIVYELALPMIIKAYNCFHVSLLNKYVHDSNHVIDWNLIQVEPEGDFQVQPVCILDKKVTVLRNKTIGKVKIKLLT